MTGFRRLEGRVALITGAASGIGRASTELFAAEGAKVLAVDRPGSGIDTLYQGLENVATLSKSVSDADAPAVMLARVIERFGCLDILFNNAGVVPVGAIDSLSDEIWQHTFDVNVTAVFRTCRCAVPYLIAQARETGRARIINTTSIMARFSDRGMAAYAASKHALAGLTKTLAAELGVEGVSANYLLPGAILTGMTDSLFSDPQVRHGWEQAAALKRLGVPLDIARAALLLASDEADFITGHGLVVDGGLSITAGPQLPV